MDRPTDQAPARLPDGRFPSADPSKWVKKEKPSMWYEKNLSNAALAAVLGVDRSFDTRQGEVLPAPAGRAAALRHLDSVGLDRICEAVAAGLTHPEVAREFGVGYGDFRSWVSAESARARAIEAAGKASGDAWMDRGLQRLEAASDALELGKAREIVQHCRKMAAIRDRRYSDRVQVDTEVTLAQDPQALEARLQALLGLDSTPDSTPPTA